MFVRIMKSVAVMSLLSVSALSVVVSDAEAGKRRDKIKAIRGAPGPIAGAGLPFLAVIGGYVYFRRKKRDWSKKV